MRSAGNDSEANQVGARSEASLGEVVAHVRGEVDLPCRIVDDPSAQRILALRKRMKFSRQKFADRFGLDARALLTVIDRDPEAVEPALGE